MSDRVEYEIDYQNGIDILSKQIDTYNHYQATAQRFIAILSTGVAIMVSFTIGSISILNFREILEKEVQFGVLAQELSVDSSSLFLIWLLTPFLVLMIVGLAILFFYDSFRIHSSVLAIESPHPAQAENSRVNLRKDSTPTDLDLQDSIQVNSKIINEIKNRIVAGNEQAKRGLFSMVIAAIIAVYFYSPDHNMAMISGIGVTFGVFLMYKFQEDEKFRNKLFPKSSNIMVSLIFTMGGVAWILLMVNVLLWVIGWVGNI